MVDGVCGDSNIANLFRRKYLSLYNSVKSLDEEMIELSESIKSAIAKECDCAETVKERIHCHDIDNSDVSKAVAKLTRCTRGDARSFFCTYKTYLYAQN